MAFPRIGGQGVGLNISNALGSSQQFGAQVLQSGGFTQSPGSNVVTLLAGQTFNIPSGTFMVAPGPYTSVQWLDPVSNAGLNTNVNLTNAVNGIWRTCNAALSQRPIVIDSDGGNFRLANLTGCAVGAVVTNAGSGATNGIGQVATGMVVTPSAGGSTWVPVVGGGAGGAVTIGNVVSGGTAGGQNYQYAPTIVIGAPPQGGVQATATCTISAGSIATVTFLNTGAGYTSPPPISVVNDSRDLVGNGALITANATLTGTGSLLALYPVNHGTSLTATPTFSTITGAGAAAATILMNYVIVGWNAGTGAGFAATATIWSTVLPGLTPAPAANTVNPIVGAGTITASTGGQTLGQPYCTAFRPCTLAQITSAGGATQGSATAGFIPDAGFGYPNATGTMQTLQPFGVSALPAQTPNYGGITDTSWLQPI